MPWRGDAMNCVIVETCHGASLQAVQPPTKKRPPHTVDLTETEKDELVENFHRFEKQKHSSVLPRAFTERGLYMLATILKSPKAVDTTIAIVEVYAKLRELSRVMVELPQQEEGTVIQKQLLHRGGQLIEDLVTDVLPKQSSETSFELNLAMFKFRHSVRREKGGNL